MSTRGQPEWDRVQRKAYCWKHFTEYKDKNGKVRAQCKYCDRNYAAPSKNGTSGMNRHMKACKTHPDNVGNTNIGSRSRGSFLDNMFGGEEDEEVPWEFDQGGIHKAMIFMAIDCELPFDFADKGGFRSLMSAICPQFVIPSKLKVVKDCLKMYVDERSKLKAFFRESGQRVSLTTELWTSSQNNKYVCLTSHFIDEDWKLRKKVLNFLPCQSHKSDDIGFLVEECLQDWGIGKIFTITVDNASSNDTAVAYLRRQFASQGQTILGGKYMHMRCMARIIHLVVRDLLKDMNESVERVRTVASYVRGSTMRFDKFYDLADELGIDNEKYLCCDDPTRWRTVYKMLEATVPFQRVFERYEARDADFRSAFTSPGPYGNIGLPTKADWIVVARLVRVLSVLYNVTYQISGAQFVSSNMFFDEILYIDDMIKKWMNSADQVLVDIAARMKVKFDKYWGNIEKMNMLLYVAIILDPRCKASYVTFAMKNMYGDEIGGYMTKLANNALNDLFIEYRTMFATTTPASASSNVCGVGNTMLYEMETELERYLCQSLETDDGDFDLLKWWKVRAKNYPVLSRLARDVLAMPISTMASEKAFNMEGGRVVSDYRASLPKKTRQAMVCLKTWINEETYKAVEEEEDYIISEQVARESRARFAGF